MPAGQRHIPVDFETIRGLVADGTCLVDHLDVCVHISNATHAAGRKIGESIAQSLVTTFDAYDELLEIGREGSEPDTRSREEFQHLLPATLPRRIDELKSARIRAAAVT